MPGACRKPQPDAKHPLGDLGMDSRARRGRQGEGDDVGARRSGAETAPVPLAPCGLESRILFAQSPRRARRVRAGPRSALASDVEEKLIRLRRLGPLVPFVAFVPFVRTPMQPKRPCVPMPNPARVTTARWRAVFSKRVSWNTGTIYIFPVSGWLEPCDKIYAVPVLPRAGVPLRLLCADCVEKLGSRTSRRKRDRDRRSLFYDRAACAPIARLGMALAGFPSTSASGAAAAYRETDFFNSIRHLRTFTATAHHAGKQAQASGC